jgi:hypothetical protein
VADKDVLVVARLFVEDTVGDVNFGGDMAGCEDRELVVGIAAVMMTVSGS